jgi:hypothetical protein
MTQHLLDLAGIGSERLHLAWVSSAEAQRFVDVVTETTATVKALGRLDGDGFADQLAAAEATLTGETLRWMVGKEVTITVKGDVYGRKWDTNTFESILDQVLEREFHKNLILQAIKNGHTSVRAINASIGLDLQRISYLLADMEKTSMVEFRGMEDRVPVFAAL